MPFTPHDAARDMVGRAEALILLAASLRQRRIRERIGVVAKAPVRTDLRRLAIVMAVAALDTYMHRLIVARAYTKSPMPRKLADVTVRFGDLIDLADASVASHRAGRNSRPRVPAKRVLRERLLRETFQRYDRVADALAMAGRPGAWDEIASEMPGEPSVAEVKAELNGLVERRNAIVHEGDYERLDRPQTPKLVNVSPKEAREAVKFVSDLVDAIHAVVS